MMKERKEFPQGEFSCFERVLECSETRCIFSPWLDSLFIVARVDLGLGARAQCALLAQCGYLYSCLARATRLARVPIFVLSAPLPRLAPVLVFTLSAPCALSASQAGSFFNFLLIFFLFQAFNPSFLYVQAMNRKNINS